MTNAPHPVTQRNSDLPAELQRLMSGHSATWVLRQQPVKWQPAAWKREWSRHNLPHAHVLDELENEVAAHGTIRRTFIFSYHNRAPLELLTAVLAWGYGTTGYGPARARSIVKQPGAAAVISSVVATARKHGAAAGYRSYYANGQLDGLSVAFITKLLHFAAYQSEQRPRPLIYDQRVSAAVTRLPSAPLLPSITERFTTAAYRRYCDWAENVAAQFHTEPVALEWALFDLGGSIRGAFPS